MQTNLTRSSKHNFIAELRKINIWW